MIIDEGDISMNFGFWMAFFTMLIMGETIRKRKRNL